ncbi:MAG: DUF2851 family protein [Chthoniobacter sp.]|nr:DUF2851 family protein [Chthoniobacter sp.]
MNAADRYAKLLPDGVHEMPLLRVPRELTEMELQAHWFAGDFGREFRTVAGGSARVVQFGVWNREAGPDFAEAAVSLDGGPPVRGSIELDPEARDWERHGHAENSDYEKVVLHVFTRSGAGEFFTRTAQHRNVPQVLLDVTSLTSEPPNPLPAAIPGRCCAPLRELAEEQAREVLLGAAQFRLRKKAAALATLAELHGADEALYQAIAATLGYKSNKLPFTLLAQRLPLRLLRKGDADALLFGVSGFLPATDLAAFDAPTRSYLRELWERWWPRRAEFERMAIAPKFWRMAGQRPANHPQRRLAALAEIIRHWPKVRTLRDRCEPGAIHEFFATLRDDYWEHHFTVSSRPSAKRMALVGESRVTEMLANVFLPLAITADPTRWATFQNLRAPLANQRVEIAALRLFGDSPRGSEFLKYAALQQGLLQVYEDFCLRDATDCVHCPFPRQLAKW